MRSLKAGDIRQALQQHQAQNTITGYLRDSGLTVVVYNAFFEIRFSPRNAAEVYDLGDRVEYTPAELTRDCLPGWTSWFNPNGHDLRICPEVILYYAAMERVFLAGRRQRNVDTISAMRHIWQTGNLGDMKLVARKIPETNRAQFAPSYAGAVSRTPSAAIPYIEPPAIGINL